MNDRGSLESAAYGQLPRNVQVLCLPRDKKVRLAYSVYNPSEEALACPSERGRTIFAEKFQTNDNLKSLAYLCARALAKYFGAEALDIGKDDPELLRFQLDSIDPDFPLEGIYEIDDRDFWKRITLAKTQDPALRPKGDDHDWKGEGIALKFAELIENCPAEHWPEAKMNDLIAKVKDYVKHLRIRTLEPLRDATVQRYFERDSDTDKTSTTDVSSTTEEDPEDIEGTDDTELERMESLRISLKGDIRRSSWSFVSEKGDDEYQENVRLVQRLTDQTNRRREERRKRRAEQMERRQIREDKLDARKEAMMNATPPKRVKIENFLDLPVEEVEDDENKKLDERNLQSYLKMKRKDVFSPNRCSHVDLSFIGKFDKLVSLYIEFKPPRGKYELRHFLFSHSDVKNLAIGIRFLENLRTFRLRSSKMNYMMLATLVFALNQTNVEEIDFGNDSLDDDCDMALRELFQGTTTIRSLELEGNHLGVSTMIRLGKVLQRYTGKLEYLGLARNDIGNEGIHALLSKLAHQKQVESLNLAGNKMSDMVIWCCISDELLRKHKVLRYLDIMGTPISSRGGDILANTMKDNHTLLGLDCRGCNLSEQIETEIEVYVQRNRYMAENPYIGDKSRTAEEIEEFINRVKNPVILDVEARIKRDQECVPDRRDPPDSPPEFASEVSTQSDGMETSRSSFVPETPGMFVYDVSAFDLDQVLKHVYIPGPEIRQRNTNPKMDDDESD